MENEDEPRQKLLKALEEYGIDLDEFKRVLALVLIFQDIPSPPNPVYLLEKYLRYIRAPQVSDEYLWGLHPSLRYKFEAYCNKYDITTSKKENNDE